ncbi:MAG TPA: hypothetical protein VNV86_22965 [Candidatus Acidoferrum sp.]|nr:hypothetical protein [Candidatus Acidoferrum sp.]
MWLSSRLPGGHQGWAIVTQHLRMLGGMTIGMLVGMWIRFAAFESRRRYCPVPR